MSKISDMPWFRFFGGKYYPFVNIASNDIAGIVFKAVCCYVCDENENMPDMSDPFVMALFQSIKKDIDDSYNAYLIQVESGKKGGRPKKTHPNRGLPTVTHPNHTEPYRTEEELEEELDAERELKEETLCSPAVFSIPKLKEVETYFKDHCLNGNASKFFYYYFSVGWTRNGAPITDWKSLAHVWSEREKIDTTDTPQEVPSKPQSDNESKVIPEAFRERFGNDYKAYWQWRNQ